MCRRLHLLLGISLLLGGASARLQAQGAGQVYRIRLPRTALDSRFDLSVGYPVAGGARRVVASASGSATAGDGGWEVTVALDPARCEMTCVYRRLRENTLLLPPVAEIRLHSGPGSPVPPIVFDPGGLHLPAAADPASFRRGLTCLAARPFCGVPMASVVGLLPPDPPVSRPSSVVAPLSAATAARPLRI